MIVSNWNRQAIPSPKCKVFGGEGWMWVSNLLHQVLCTWMWPNRWEEQLKEGKGVCGLWSEGTIYHSSEGMTTRTGGSWELTSQQLKKAEGRCWIALLIFPSSFNPGSYQKNAMQTTFIARASLLNYLFPRSLKDRHIQSHASLMV